MSNADVLVPGIMSLNDWIEAAIKVEAFMKTDAGVEAEDPLAVVRTFLNGDGDFTNGIVHAADGHSPKARRAVERKQ